MNIFRLYLVYEIGGVKLELEPSIPNLVFGIIKIFGFGIEFQLHNLNSIRKGVEF